MTKTRKLAYLALFISSLLWGLAPPIIKYSFNFISPVSFLFLRFTLACLIFAPFFIYKIQKVKPSLPDWGQYILLGFLCTPLNLLLYFLGVERTSAMDASVVAILAPIFVVCGGVLFLKENLTKRETLGIIIAVAGTVVITLTPILTQKNSFMQNLFGNLLIISGDIVWAVFTLLSKREKNRHLDAFLISSFSFFVGWVSFLPLYLGEKAAIAFNFSFDARALPGIIYMAVFSSVIAYSAYIYGLKKIEASEATIFTYLQPIFAIPIAMSLLKERLATPLVIGAILITLGVFICEYRFRSEPR